MRGADIGGAAWYDIDTVADLTTAERIAVTAEADRHERATPPGPQMR